MFNRLFFENGRKKVLINGLFNMHLLFTCTVYMGAFSIDAFMVKFFMNSGLIEPMENREVKLFRHYSNPQAKIHLKLR